MARLFITEFSHIGETSLGRSQIVQMPPVADQTPITLSGASQQSAAFDPRTKMVRLNCDGPCSVVIGSNPTVTTDNMRLSSGQTEYFAVWPGHKVAAITNT